MIASKFDESGVLVTKIKVKKLEAGSTVATDVKDISGRMLLSAGSVVTEKHLNVFKTWGVTEVEIVESDNEVTNSDSELDLNSIDPILLEKIEEKLKQQFFHNDLQHPMMKELIAHVRNEKIRALIS
jgi:hypothetical protein